MHHEASLTMFVLRLKDVLKCTPCTFFPSHNFQSPGSSEIKQRNSQEKALQEEEEGHNKH